MGVLDIVFIIGSIVVFAFVFATKSNKTQYHPRIKGPRGRLPGRDPEPKPAAKPEEKKEG